MLKKYINGSITLLFFILATLIEIQNVRADKDYCKCTLSRVGKNKEIITREWWTWTPFGCSVWGTLEEEGPWQSCCCWNNPPNQCWDGMGGQCVPGKINMERLSHTPNHPDPKETAGRNVPPGHMTDPHPIPR